MTVTAPSHFTGVLRSVQSRISLSRYFLLLAFSVCFAMGGTAIAQVSVVNMGTSNVGAESSSTPVTVTMIASGIATAPSALTQGISGLDYAVASGGSCASGTAYTVGQQCTVNVTFTPKYPGVRNGAIEIVSGSGGLLGVTVLTGTGVGSLSVLVPGRIDTVAGDGDWIYRGDGVAATLAPIFLPTSVVVDAAGNLFLSDSNNNRVRRVDAITGLISTVAGNGNPGFSGDGGLATQAMLNTPAGLALDGAGNLYFADSGNHAIRRVDAVSGVITTVAGIGGVEGYSGDSSAATAAKLSLPEGIAFDAAMNLYIADTGNNVLRLVSAANGTITTIAGTGAAGYNGDGIAANTAQLNSPWSVTVGLDGSIYVADLQNNRIRKIKNGGISTVAGSGNRGFSGDGAGALQATLNAPASVVLDPAGNLYIADSGNNRVRLVTSSNGFIQTLAGTDSEQFGGDTGAANLASMYGPYALYFDQTGNLFVADMFHNRVRRINGSAIALQYATIRVGKVSPPQTEGVMNAGNASMTLAAPTLVNAAADPSTTTCNTGSILGIDQTCNIGVEFAPTTLGATVLGTFSVNSGAGNSPDVISLSGTVLSVNPTSVSLSSSLNPSLVGAAVTFSASVASGGATPTGTVTFLDGTTTLCSVPLSAQYTASCTPPSLTLGQHSITASYGGDASDASSTSPALVQVVKQPSTVVLVAGPNPVVVTGSVTLTATTTAATGTPSGAITFYDGATAIGSATLSDTGVATFSTTQLSAATHSLSAQYGGDGTNAAGQSNVVSEVVQKATTVTTVGSSNSSATIGSTVSFTATVASTNGPAATGLVAFTDGTTALGNGTIGSNGVATLTISTLAAGTHAIVATYAGDGSNSTSASSPLVETIQLIGTMTVVTSSVNPANAGATVQLTANVVMVAGATSYGTISGQVTFTNGGLALGSAPVGSNGSASISVNTLPVGTDSIVAVYAGNTDYATSTSAALAQVVNTTSTTTSLSESNPGVLAGKTASFTATVTTAAGTANGTVNFMDGANSVGQSMLNAQGVATLTLTTLPVGSHTITAAYVGNTNYTASSSTPVVETVSLGTAAVTLAGPATPVDAGVAVNLTGVISSNGTTPTGALTLKDGGTIIATQNAQVSGSYSFTTSTLAIGSHTLTVTYAGDADNAATVSSPLVVVVQQAPTTTSLSSNINPQVVGQPVTLTASVTSDSPNLTGSISFLDGATVLGSVSIGANGGAVYTTSSLAFGAHTLTAVYSGDTLHATSNSAAISEQIVQGAVAALSSNANPAVTGTNVILMAKLAGVGSVVPTGSVTFTDGGATLGTVALDGTGAASFQSTTLALGSHNIAVSYAGDKNYSAASATMIETVTSATTQVALTASANPATFGAPLSLVAAITTNGGVATGSVSFVDGGTAIGSAVLNASGVATLTLATLAPGSHTIVANYAGDGRATASTSSPVVVVVKQLTSVTLASSVNPAQTLSPITLTAVAKNGGVTAPTGTMTFTDGSVQLGTGTLDATGTATITLPSLAGGNHNVVASYAGDAVDFPGTSQVLTQSVALRTTLTTLTSKLTDPNNPQQVTLISVERWTGSVTPTGTVTFTTGSAVLGTIPVDATGVATLNIVLPPSGSESVVATYAGDTVYSGSSSASVSVSGGQATQFTMQTDPATVSVQSKEHSVVTLSISSVQGFADTLQLGCAGLPTAATCTFSTTQMALASGGTSTAQVTIDTGNPLGAGPSASVRGTSSNALLCFVPVGLLAGLMLFRSRRRSLPALLLLICAIAATLGSTGCAGLQVNGTPAGNYTFRITAVGAATGVSESTVVTLNVTQ